MSFRLFLLTLPLFKQYFSWQLWEYRYRFCHLAISKSIYVIFIFLNLERSVMNSFSLQWSWLNIILFLCLISHNMEHYFALCISFLESIIQIIQSFFSISCLLFKIYALLLWVQMSNLRTFCFSLLGGEILFRWARMVSVKVAKVPKWAFSPAYIIQRCLKIWLLPPGFLSENIIKT